MHWRQPSANGNNLHEMVIVASIQSSGSHPGQWDQFFFLGGCACGAVNFTNELQKERKKEKEGSISDGSLLMKEFILSGNHSPFVCEERMCFYCY